MQVYFRGVSKKCFEAVHVLCFYSRVAKLYSVERASLNLFTDPILAEVKSLDPPFIQTSRL